MDADTDHAKDLPRIFGWLADKQGCGYWRIMLPLCELERRGARTAFDLRMPAEFCTGDRLDNIQVVDGDEPIIVVGQRISQPVPSATWQDFAKVPRFKLVYEIDDDLLHIDPENTKAYEAYKDPDVRRRLVENVAVAHLVTCTTEPLAEVLRGYNPNVVVVPNYVDAAALDYPRPNWEGVAVGWAGSGTHAADFDTVSPHLRSFYRANPDVWWSSAGCDYGRLTGATRRRHSGWRDIVDDQGDYFARFTWDVGIAPLKDTPFNRSKSGLKALEYAACGIPVIASDLDPYRGIVVEGVTGYLATTRREWLDALSTLARNKHLRAWMGKQARKHAANHTIQANGHRWTEALRSVL